MCMAGGGSHGAGGHARRGGGSSCMERELLSAEFPVQFGVGFAEAGAAAFRPASIHLRSGWLGPYRESTDDGGSM